VTTTATPDTAAAYSAALDILAAARLRPDADEPRPGARTPRDEALHVAAAARRAMVAEYGEAAARSAEADADLRTVRNALAAALAAQTAGVRVVEQLDALLTQETAGQARAEAAAEAARVDAEAMAARIALEDDHAAELGILAEHLAGKGRTLSAAATRAETALCDLFRESAAYDAAVTEARRRLAEAGFDDSTRFDGEPHPTRAGTVLFVSGRRWPSVDPVEAVARATRRVAAATGVRGRRLVDALRPRDGRELAAEPVLVNTPLPRLGVGEVR